MYVRLQKIACMCVCPSSVFNFSQRTPVVLPYRQDQTLKIDSLPFLGLNFPGCVFPVWSFPVPGSCSGITPMIWSLNLRKRAPWIGLVMNSPIISQVGHHTNDTLTCATLSVINKYQIFMCLVRLLFEDFPFFSRRIELLLSWNKTLPSKNAGSDRSPAWIHQGPPVQSL